MQDSDLQELQKDTFVVVLILVAILGILLFYIRLLLFVDTVPFHFQLESLWWMPPVLILLTCYFSYKLHKKDKFRWGTYLFIGGLILAVNSLMVGPNPLFNRIHIYLLVLVVAMAGLLINPQAAAQAAGVTVVVTTGVAFIVNGFSWATIQPLLAPLAMACGMAAISWINADYLITAVQWAMDSQKRAAQRSQELFESEQKLQKAYTLLETTNIRLREAEAAATKANELKTRFIRNLSHELRTPLSAIINFSYILSQNYHGAVTKEQQDYLMRIHDSGELLLDIVNDLLDLAKVESGQMNLFLEPVDVAVIGRSVMNTICGVVADRPVELCQEIPPDLPLITGDETRIRQVLLNLLGNAAKYTNEGSITLRMAQNEDEFVQISVIDTGIGIKPDDFDRIFEEFQQTEEAFALRKVGTGLGLSISKKFVELHGGQMWVESKYGRGSVFHFTLPIAVDSQDAPEEAMCSIDTPESKVANR